MNGDGTDNGIIVRLRRKLDALGVSEEAIQISIEAVEASIRVKLTDHYITEGYRRDVGPSEWKALRQHIFMRDGYRCVYCDADVSAEPECDHIIPVFRGGRSILKNLATACKPCNRSKGDKTLEEWQPHS